MAVESTGQNLGVDFASIPDLLKRDVTPRRSLPGSAKPRTPAYVTKWVQKTYATKLYSYGKYSYAKLFERGLEASKTRPFANERAKAHELLSSFDVASLAKLSLEVLAVAERMTMHVSSKESLAPAIAAERGLADAVRVVARAGELGTEASGGYDNAVFIVADAAQNRQSGAPLRHLLCAAPKKDYDEARRVAEELRQKGGPARHQLLAYLFPDEPWGTRDLSAHLDARVKAASNPNYPRHLDPPAWTLLSATRDADLVRRWIEVDGPFHVATFAIELACVLSPEDSVSIFSDVIAKMLVKPKYGPLHKTPPRDVAHALGCVGTKEAAAALAPYAGNAILGPQVLAWFHDHSKFGAVLEARAKGRGKLEATTARVLRKQSSDDPRPVASTSEAPAVLRDMPWRAQKKNAGRTKDARVVIEDLALLGLGLEKVKLVRPVTRSHGDIPCNVVRPMTAAELVEWKKEAATKNEWVRCDIDAEPVQVGGKWEYRRVPEREGLARWNERGNSSLMDGELAWVARHGIAALPGFGHRDWIKWLLWDGNEEVFEGIRSMISPRVAPSIARVAARRKRHRRVARAWLIENAEVAVYGLIPDALGSKAEPRADAEAALLLLQSQGHEALIREVARTYAQGTKKSGAHQDLTRGIDALLARDPLALEIATPPKRPAFLRVEELPQVLLQGGKKASGAAPKAIDDAAHSAIVEMLQMASVDDPYPGLALVREACEQASLGALALELVEQWVIGDAPGRHEWMLFAVVHFPSERATRRVSELAREWARKNQAKALRACAALAAIAALEAGDPHATGKTSDAATTSNAGEVGQSLALMHLAHIAETTRFASLKKDVSELVKDAAAARGLTEEQLGDQTIPDAGLGADGTITLSYGGTKSTSAREFVVGVSASLEPVVRQKLDAKGTLGPRETTIPRPSKTDDPVLAKKARERFDELKKDLAAIAQRQVRRLEHAMALGRAWPVREIEALFAHPLLRTLARSLVWQVVSTTHTCFRVAEDGSYADVKDNAFKLPAKATIRIAHPAEADLSAWVTVFGDYEIVQPFEQLGRVVILLTEPEKKAKELVRASAIQAPARKMLGTMESRGWRRDDPGLVSVWLRALPSQREARWPISPGISMESLAMGGGATDVVTTQNLVVVGPDGKALPLEAIDAALFSEIARDVEAVRNLAP